MYTDKITQAVAEAVKQVLATEKLHPNQQKLDVHEPEKDELTSNDFKMLRKGKKADVKEGWQDMLDDVKKRAAPQPNGGAGMKQGSRYGGSKQKDEPEKKEVKEDIGQIGEASYINGVKQNPESKVWKLTSMSHADAVAKHGKENVRHADAVNRSGDKTGKKHVEVLSKLGEDVDINAINGVKMSNVDESSHQAKTTMKHIPNASPELKKAAKDIKPGIAGFRDRVAMLKAGGVK
jgi:hypothetical protein